VRVVHSGVGVSLDELAGRKDVSSENTIKNHELSRLHRKVNQLSDEDQMALWVVLDSLVKRSRVSRVMTETKPLKGPWNRISIRNASSPRVARHADGREAERRAEPAGIDGRAAGAHAGPGCVEEEDFTPETTAGLDRARASLARGDDIPHEEILREFGLKQ
jgi:hypothetical protein